MTAIVWFRRDLRLHDHAALHIAMQTGDPIIPVFILDDWFCRSGTVGDKRLFAYFAAVQSLANNLAHVGGRLLIRHGDPVQVLSQLAKETGADKLFFNRDYTPYARKRDQSVCDALTSEGVMVQSCKDLVLHEPAEILTKQRTPYAVFTPYRRLWQTLPKEQPYPIPERWLMFDRLNELPGEALPTLEAFGRKALTGDEWTVQRFGERAACERLKQYLNGDIQQYKDRRDMPGLDATSRLSFALKAGTLSIRTVYYLVHEALEEARGEGVTSIEAFITELIWREFYQQVLFFHPKTTEQAFLPQFEGVKWENNPELLARWCEGETGYPIVDAAMKQLGETGWMHNRLRMITASFLTKDLLIDWRYGMAYFAKKLIDYDEAANSGGWQWSASTGTDPQPYFRIFNPISQGEKFDPDGVFVKKYLPVLRDVPLQYIHKPWEMPKEVQEQANCVIGLDYPVPCVDHAERRKLALSLFQEAKDRHLMQKQNE